jgi:hypothetical protein
VVGIGLVITGGLWWVQGGPYKPPSTNGVGTAIAEYEATKAAHGALQRQAVIEQLGKPSPRPRGVSESDHLASLPAAQDAAAEIVEDAQTEEARQIMALKQEQAKASATRFAQQESAELLSLIDALEKEMWKLRLELKQSSPLPFETLPREFLAKAHACNQRVFDLARGQLSNQEAGDVKLFPTLLTGMLGAKTLKPMFDSNRATLRLIQRKVARE